MILSKAQVSLFWRLWAQTCRVQGWTTEAGFTRAEIDAKRKEALASCGFNSLRSVDRSAGFGRVKAALETLCERVDGAIEADHPEMDDARRRRHVILTRIIPCLGVYVADPVGYAETVAREKFGLAWQTPVDIYSLSITPRVAPGPGGCLIERPSQLDQLLMTLSARLDALRRQAGHTYHAMYTAAKVPCSCSSCRRLASSAAPCTADCANPF